VRAFVESCRYPHQAAGVDPALPSPLARRDGAVVPAPGPGLLGLGTRGRGSEATAAPVWGVTELGYFRFCDPWPLNPEGELLLGVKIESPEGVARCEEILAVPGLGFAEMGPGDLGLSLLGDVVVRVEPYAPEVLAARDRVFAAARARGLAFLEGCSPATIAARLDAGVRVIAGGQEETARVGRAHQRRAMPV
jgi:4-hydroxy-2-oxoheptanedioate aldolase